MIASSPATASGRPNRSRHGWPSGWRSEDLPSTRTDLDHPSSRRFDFRVQHPQLPQRQAALEPSTAAISGSGSSHVSVPDHARRLGARLIQTLNTIISMAASTDGGVQRGVLAAGRLRVEARAQVSHTPPPQQAEAVDRRPLLRPVPPAPEGPMGARRPRQRRLPPEVLLDQHRPAPAGHRRSVP